MSFDPVWASDDNALIDVPSDAEIRTGFVCGPVTPGRFNWLFQSIMSMINSLGIADMASKFRLINTADGISGGGNLEADLTLRLDIPSLQERTSIANDDWICIHRPTDAAPRKMTRANFVQGLGASGDTGDPVGFIFGAQNIGDGDGELYSGIDDGQLEFRTIDGDGIDVLTTGDLVVLSLPDRAADLTFS